MDHSYEEIRNAAVQILAGKSPLPDRPSQYSGFARMVARLLEVIDGAGADRQSTGTRQNARLSMPDSALFREVFWDLFRCGFITLGLDDSNSQYPFFRVSSFGRRAFESDETWLVHDVSSYEKAIRERVPGIDEVTLLYLKEAMQAFLGGCTLSSSVMLGVAAEHSFELLLEVVERSPELSRTFRKALKERSFARRFNEFRKVLMSGANPLPGEVKHNLETDLVTILSMIRNYRNESGHPSGRLIDRDTCFVLLRAFPICCEKIYQIREHFASVAEGRSEE